MTVSLAGRAPATFEIKSANLPLVALLLKSADLAALAHDLAERFGDIPDFFDNEPLVIDLTPLAPNAAPDAQTDAAADAPIDFTALIALLRGYRLAPIAVRGGTATQMAQALAAGLTAAPDARVTSPAARAAAEAPASNTAGDDAAAAPAGQAAANAPERAPDAAASTIHAPAQPAIPPAPGALVINKPLRSGQQVYARGRDLVVLSMVNAGAEVIADGHIHVYAPLRGKAIAGARGNADARIFALSLEPELLSIAGIYRTSEAPLPGGVHGKPAQVRLGGEPGAEKLFIEPLAT
jgi:septum site-determining protein MinC